MVFIFYFPMWMPFTSPLECLQHMQCFWEIAKVSLPLQRPSVRLRFWGCSGPSRGLHGAARGLPNLPVALGVKPRF